MFCAIVVTQLRHVKRVGVQVPQTQPEYIARRPVQARSKAKVQHMLEVAADMLREGRVDEFSLPKLAQAAEVPKATVYQFFPTKYALFNTLGETHLSHVEELIRQGFDIKVSPDWRSALRYLIRSVADYYVDEHGARALLLGGSLTPQLYEAQENTLQRVANTVRELFRNAYDVPDLPREPDVYLINCEIVRAVFATGEYTLHAMTPEIVEEACRVSVGYMGQYLD